MSSVRWFLRGCSTTPEKRLRARRPKEGSTAPRTTVPTDVERGTTLVLALLQLRYHDLTNIWSPVVEARRNATPQVLMRAAMEAICALSEPAGDAVE